MSNNEAARSTMSAPDVSEANYSEAAINTTPALDVTGPSDNKATISSTAAPIVSDLSINEGGMDHENTLILTALTGLERGQAHEGLSMDHKGAAKHGAGTDLDADAILKPTPNSWANQADGLVSTGYTTAAKQEATIQHEASTNPKRSQADYKASTENETNVIHGSLGHTIGTVHEADTNHEGSQAGRKAPMDQEAARDHETARIPDISPPDHDNTAIEYEAATNLEVSQTLSWRSIVKIDDVVGR